MWHQLRLFIVGVVGWARHALKNDEVSQSVVVVVGVIERCTATQQLLKANKDVPQRDSASRFSSVLGNRLGHGARRGSPLTFRMLCVLLCVGSECAIARVCRGKSIVLRVKWFFRFLSRKRLKIGTVARCCCFYWCCCCCGCYCCCYDCCSWNWSFYWLLLLLLLL